ncbi:hypothetical protein GMD78_11685 [Ornithinibacillus sp. L9]|uniref:DUF8042 domain-containing protein n=1 Tax=Ornithinibacillus caprae TaxID=2678566 RepID=A0A6N8FL04_9BACI|nr:hypothetical protein [Ornithinibacillus caprae]MUK89034.1 hypothetical protein [Ornithinibacillus caprae]
MENYLSIMKQSQNLQETVQEGLEHIQSLLKVGKYEATITLFSDIVQAFATIESTLRVIPKEVVTDDINEMTAKIKETLNIIVSSYEDQNYAKVEEVFQFNLMPRFNKWKTKLEEVFNPFLLS